MKRIIIDIYDKSDSLGEFIRITSDEYNFDYASHGSGHGLQCGYEGGTDEHKELGFRLARLADLAGKVDIYHEHTKEGD